MDRTGTEVVLSPMQALTWSPWLPKLLATGDSGPTGRGTIQLWNVNASSAYSNAADPGKIELAAQITSLHFSPHCKEILSTHGPGPAPTTDSPAQDTQSRPLINNSNIPNTDVLAPPMNSIVVHSYPSLRHVTEVSAAPSAISDSVLSTNGMKVIFAVPGEAKLKVWDVWGKRKEVRKHSTFLGGVCIR